MSGLPGLNCGEGAGGQRRRSEWHSVQKSRVGDNTTRCTEHPDSLAFPLKPKSIESQAAPDAHSRRDQARGRHRKTHSGLWAAHHPHKLVSGQPGNGRKDGGVNFPLLIKGNGGARTANAQAALIACLISLPSRTTTSGHFDNTHSLKLSSAAPSLRAKGRAWTIGKL